ncbi:MAG: translation initiation factor IF-2, partial [Candidatus Brocadiales bacterium]
MPEKFRISTLAKELGVKSGSILEKCKEHGLGHLTHHANTIDAKEASLIRRLFEPSVRPAKTAEAKKAVVTAPKPKKAPRPAAHKTPTKQPVTPAAQETKDKGKAATLPPKGKTDVKGTQATDTRSISKLIRPPKFIEVRRRPPFRKPSRPGFRGRKGPWKKVARSSREVAAVARPIAEGLKISLESPITVKELSAKLGIKASNIIMKLLMEHNVRATMNQALDDDVVQVLGMEYGADIELKKAPEAGQEIEREFAERPSRPEDLVPRPPIVTFLGHVDHGKTSLLDAIRQANVAGREAGGITQHIGAYHVETNGRTVTFLDTPGHEAFTAMRARGSQTTDVAVLVVAADDGVMPQTQEAINHARAANVPIVVAVNKIDKPDANPMKVKQQLAKLDLTPEEWGGKTGFVETSATNGTGLDELLERLLLEAELLELKANPKNPARGVVLEAQLHEGRGVVAKVIVRDGTLHLGDVILCGQAFGKARAMYDDNGKAIKHAGPSLPISVSDLSVVPSAGDKFYAINDIQKARQIAAKRQESLREAGLQAREHVTLENLYTNIER